MKKCSVCKENKDFSEFNYQNKKTGKKMSACKNCSSKRQRENRIKNSEKIKEKDRARYKKESDHRVNYARQYRLKNKNKTRDTNLYTKYRIRQEDYEKMKKEQNSRCAICGEKQENLKRILCVDHCHDTGKVRGLLCDTCNKFLGFYEKLEMQCKEYLLNRS